MQALTVYMLYASQPDRATKLIANQPQVSREVNHFKENIGKIKSVEQLMENPRVYNFAMRAYGLDDIAYAKGLMRKVLEGGVGEPNALANRMNDPRYREFASDFDFAGKGEEATSGAEFAQKIADKYLRQTMELEESGKNDGARLALYFERKADEIDSPRDILADKALLSFAQTAFQLSTAMGALSIEKQEEMLADRFDIDDLKDPEKLEKLRNRFLALWDQQNSQSVYVPPLVGTSSPQPFSMSLLASIQNLK